MMQYPVDKEATVLVCEPYEPQKCRGMRAVMPFYGRFFYWGKKIDRLHIAVDKSIGFVDRLINVVLMVVGFFGLGILLYVAWLSDCETLFSGAYWVTPSWEKAVFWITVLTDLYLYYRLEQATAPRKRVLQRVFGQTPELPSGLSWDEIARQPKRALIDVSDAFSQNALELLNRAWQLAYDFKHTEMTRLHIFASVPQFDQGALIWGRLGMRGEAFRDKVGRALGWHMEGGTLRTELSAEVHKLLLTAYKTAYDNGKKKVDVSDIVLALSRTDILNDEEKANE